MKKTYRFCRDCRYCGVYILGGIGVDTRKCSRFLDPDPNPISGFNFARCEAVNSHFDCDAFEPNLSLFQRLFLGRRYKLNPEVLDFSNEN